MLPINGSRDQDPEYQPLMEDDLDPDARSATPSASPWASRTVLLALLAVETAALLAVILLFVRAPQQNCSVALDSGQVLYSPALGAVETEVKVFNVGFSDNFSDFQIPSSPHLDKMWSDLYNFGVSRITKDEASMLPNKTEEIPGDEGHYIAALDVFHTLHCLNKIRMALDPDYYPAWRISTANNWIPEQKNVTQHISHCVEWLRQSIMCTSDTSVIVWQWDSARNTSVFRSDVAHTCRKFDNVQAWAKERVIHEQGEELVHV
ncbi:hypothetical protein FB45DRAFT_1053696 [Roridomyces roridus]|uniref:Tat pathway signal sequence n=1 Tax=Roridomyces roridus TaxID=1738132 RepID=A0AAD7FSR4_9AGAR|nr:hypothetical protein FB45DRAFT_1053696 [Roridomyces roridus]